MVLEIGAIHTAGCTGGFEDQLPPLSALCFRSSLPQHLAAVHWT